MADMAEVLKLVQTTQRERVSVASFLREWADAVENDGKTLAAIIILYQEETPDLFCTSSRRCNLSKIETAGLMQFALTDLCAAD